MLVRLPRNVAALAQCAAKTEHLRFGATTGIRVKVTDDQILRLEATDGRMLGMVQCPPCLDGDWDRAEMVVDAQNLDPDETAEVVIPLDVWARGFKLDEDRYRDKGAVVLATEANNITFATHLANRRTQCVEGRFPDFDRVFPHANNRTPMFSVNIDPKLMIRLLQCAMACTSEDVKAVTLIYYGRGVPLGVCCRNPEANQAFDGLLVPLLSAEEAERCKALPAPPRPALPPPRDDDNDLVETRAAALTADDLVASPWSNSLGWDVRFPDAPEDEPYYQVTKESDGRLVVCSIGPEDDAEEPDRVPVTEREDPIKAVLEAIAIHNDVPDERVTAFESTVKLSADSPEQLRKCDVQRVVDAARGHGHLFAFVHWLAEKRPDLKEEIEACLARVEPLPKLSELFLKVEYDPEYRGGDYRGEGKVALVPVPLADTLGVDEAFRRTTGLDPVHIVNCCGDDIYDADGDPVEEWETDTQEEEHADEE